MGGGGANCANAPMRQHTQPAPAACNSLWNTNAIDVTRVTRAAFHAYATTFNKHDRLTV